LKDSGRKGKTPVKALVDVLTRRILLWNESNCLRVQFQKGGIIHQRLNNDGKPITNKYRKGKMKRTLKRELKELEVVEMEAIIF